MLGRKRILRTSIPVVLLCLALASPAEAKAPPAPQMPDNWKVISDVDFRSDDFRPIGEQLGVNLSGLRNTIYDVNGKRVQLNLIVAPDTESAGRLMAKLKTMKSEIALLCKDLICYEFVGQNDVLPMIEAGREHLEAL